MHFQNTLSAVISISGIGLHSGKVVNLTIHPAAANHGIVFKRIDADNPENALIHARFDNVIDTRMCTIIQNQFGYKVSTIEHLMAALWGLKIDNALIEIDADEVPIMDGSSKVFIKEIQNAGITTQQELRNYLIVNREIKVEDGDKYIILKPSNVFKVKCSIDFNHESIGFQETEFDLAEDCFNKDISFARTFGFLKDVEYLKSLGLAQGASLENAIGFDENGILNSEGLRHPEEIVRHKILDCVGDLYLAGHRIAAEVIAHKAGHALHNQVLRALFADEDAYFLLALNPESRAVKTK